MWQDRVHETAAEPTIGATAGGVSRRPSRPLRAGAAREWSAGERRWERPRVLHVDCDTCTVRGAACGDCVIGVLLGPPGQVELDGDEQAALSTLAESGMVPPLRLVQSVSAPGRAVSAPGQAARAETDPLDAAWDDADDGWGTPAGDWI